MLPCEPDGQFTYKRLKVLKGIFDFYDRQQLLLGKGPTFDQIGKRLSQMTLPEYLKLCSDFGFKELLEDKDPKSVFIASFKFVAENKKVINFE